MRIVITLLAFCTILVFAPYAQCQDDDHGTAEYALGDTFIFDNNRIERFAGETEEGLRWKFLSGRSFTRNKAFFLPISKWSTSRSRGTRFFKGKISKFWPLQPGKRVSFTAISDFQRKNKGESWQSSTKKRAVQFWRCKAHALEDITVKAGTFETIPITCKKYSPYNMKLLQKVDWYYAPDVGHYIRRDTFSYISGKRTSYGLVAALPGKRANAKRIRAILGALQLKST
jgi:hypothetical protein